MTGVSIGLVTRSVLIHVVKVSDTYNNHSVKMIGLFVTALVGLYTIEDLWDKFGDLRMSWVSLLPRRLLHSFIELDFPARPSQALGSENLLPYHRSDPSLHGILQNSLSDLEPIWSGRCSNELSVPGESRGQRLCQEPTWSVLRRLSTITLPHSPFYNRDRLWLKDNAQKHGLGRWPAPLPCTDVSCRFWTTTSDMLSL